MEKIIIEEKQSAFLRTTLLGLLITTIFTILFFYGHSEKIKLVSIAGVVGALFFATWTILFFMRTIKPKALFIITREGIEDSSNSSSNGFIGFEDIDHFEIVNIFGQEMIGIYPRDGEQFIKKLPVVRQRVAKSNLRMKLPPITLRVDEAKDMSIEDILSLLDKRLADFSSLYR